MALTQKIDTPQGFSADNAYISISHIESLNKTNMSFSLSYRKEKQFDVFNVKSFSCVFNVEGENPYKQAYLYLKTLPEFASATDC